MNTNKLLRTAMLLLLVFTTTLISSCGSDDEDMDPGDEAGDEISLSYNFDGTDQTAVFNSGSSFFAISDGQATVLSTSGALTSGQNYSFSLSFLGTEEGSYTLIKSVGEDDDVVDGLSLVILDGENTQVYHAKNVMLNVTSYTVVSITEIIVKGTFSGILENEDTLEEVSITNGSFVTGFKD